MKSRYFNNVYKTPNENRFIKSSSNIQKIIDEYLWFKEIPKKLKKYTPKMRDVRFEKNVAFMEMDFVDGKTYAELYLDNSLTKKDIFKALKLLNKIGKFNRNIDFDIEGYARYIYREKTFERINDLHKVPIVQELLIKEELIINGIKYDGLPKLMPKIIEWSENLVNSAKQSLVHGDYCFNNIIKEFNSQSIKLVDARGRGITQTNMGDLRYDLAKFRHSINGLYDYIVEDRYKLKIYKSNFKYSIEKPFLYDDMCITFDKFLSRKGYDVNDIRFIEGLLFLTMIPLHKENNNRQIMFFILAIKKLNEVIYG